MMFNFAGEVLSALAEGFREPARPSVWTDQRGSDKATTEGWSSRASSQFFFLFCFFAGIDYCLYLVLRIILGLFCALHSSCVPFSCLVLAVFFYFLCGRAVPAAGRF